MVIFNNVTSDVTSVTIYRKFPFPQKKEENYSSKPVLNPSEYHIKRKPSLVQRGTNIHSSNSVGPLCSTSICNKNCYSSIKSVFPPFLLLILHLLYLSALQQKGTLPPILSQTNIIFLIFL